MDTRLRMSVSIMLILGACGFIPRVSSATQPPTGAAVDQWLFERLGLKNSGLEMTPESLEHGLTMSRSIRGKALAGLAAIGTEAQIPAIEKLLEDPVNRGLEPSIYQVLINISEKMPDERRRALQSRLLTKLRIAHKVEKLNGMKLRYAYALTVLGDPAGYETIVSLLKDPFLGGSALMKISHLSYDNIRDASGKPLDWVTPVSSVLKDRSKRESDRSTAALILARLGEPGNEVLRDVLKDEPEGKIRFQIRGIFVRQEMHKDRVQGAPAGAESSTGE